VSENENFDNCSPDISIFYHWALATAEKMAEWCNYFSVHVLALRVYVVFFVMLCCHVYGLLSCHTHGCFSPYYVARGIFSAKQLLRVFTVCSIVAGGMTT